MLQSGHQKRFPESPLHVSAIPTFRHIIKNTWPTCTGNHRQFAHEKPSDVDQVDAKAQASAKNWTEKKWLQILPALMAQIQRFHETQTPLRVSYQRDSSESLLDTCYT